MGKVSVDDIQVVSPLFRPSRHFIPVMAPVSLRRPVGSTCKSAFASHRQQHLSHARRTFASTPKNTKQIEDAYIVSAVRTPCGIFNGSFTNVPATQLGSTAIRA